MRRSGFFIGGLLLFTVQPQGDESGDSRLLHGYSQEVSCAGYGFLVVGDDDELARSAELHQDVHEALNVRFIEGRVDFIEDAEW